MKKAGSGGIKIIARNKRARFRFQIFETWEAGLSLTGSEVKSLRQGNVQISEAYARLRDGEVFLFGATIGRYEQAGYAGHEPDRPRKLLLHKREIRKLRAAIEEKGCTIVPLSIYFKNGLAKIKIAVVKGRKLHDKRQAIKKRDADREIGRAMRGKENRSDRRRK
ncbi:MAG: SsrA-binding protein SmpB [Planctomycetota bacterium]